MTWKAGTVLDARYELVGPLEGVCDGLLWGARDPDATHRRFTLRPLAPIEGDALPEELAAHLRALRMVRHKHVLAVVAHGLVEGVPYVAMGPLDGVPLAAHLGAPRRAIPVAALRALWTQVADAVSAGHRMAQPVAHGDLSPATVAVGDVDGTPVARVLDAGLSQHVAPREALAHHEFVAPERTHAKAPDVAGDVFSLARLLAWMLQETARDRDAQGTWPGLRPRRDVPEAVWRALDAATEASPAARPAGVGALLDVLDAAWAEPAPEAPVTVSEAAPPEIPVVAAAPAEAPVTPLELPSLAPREENPWGTDVRHRPFVMPAGFAVAPPPAAPADENPWSTDVRMRPFRVGEGDATRAVSSESFRDIAAATNDPGTLRAKPFGAPAPTPLAPAEDDKPTVAYVRAFTAPAVNPVPVTVSPDGAPRSSRALWIVGAVIAVLVVAVGFALVR